MDGTPPAGQCLARVREISVLQFSVETRGEFSSGNSVVNHYRWTTGMDM